MSGMKSTGEKAGQSNSGSSLGLNVQNKLRFVCKQKQQFLKNKIKFMCANSQLLKRSLEFALK